MSVLLLGAAKATAHWVGLEFVTLNTLFTSAIGGAIFVFGFLLSSILYDYKEAERLPSDVRAALEAIYDEAVAFAAKAPLFDLARVRQVLTSIVTSLFAKVANRPCSSCRSANRDRKSSNSICTASVIKRCAPRPASCSTDPVPLVDALGTTVLSGDTVI